MHLEKKKIVEGYIGENVVKFRRFKFESFWEARVAAFAMVRSVCADEKFDAISECGREHSTCYKRQLGQKLCDTTFCNCLKQAQKIHEEDACGTVLNGMCAVAVAFGEEHYEKAA
uniref:Phospholipase A(2) n=1 Tax=Steinernema glaseri TaxID=37863 RepID=A0A1I7Y8Z9_9BILA